MSNHVGRGAVLCSLFLALQGSAFSLLGPFQPWMDRARGYGVGDEVGGPMNLGEEYRWNVPVVTYGFDPSFLDYFGAAGVAAVEQAISVFNALPPASQLNVTDYPLQTLRANHRAVAQGLQDLQTTTLALLVEQMGLASPLKHTFCLRDYWVQAGSTNALVIQRNFDPATWLPSPFLNGTLLAYQIYSSTNGWADAVEEPLDPLALYWAYVPIASCLELDSPSLTGWYATGLTADDVGGLRYLLSTNNVQVEDLPGDVFLQADGSTNFVHQGLRPGVDRVVLVPQPTESGVDGFVPATNLFTDTLILHGEMHQQVLQRVTVRPDILFAAADLGTVDGQPRLYSRSGVGRWANNDAINGESVLGGPGVILPPVTLIFSKLGPAYVTGVPGGTTTGWPVTMWGSFDGSTNAPVVFPSPGTYRDVLARVRLPGVQSPLAVRLTGAFGDRYQLESSTDLAEWTPVATVTNSTWLVDFELQGGAVEPQRFFRVIGR